MTDQARDGRRAEQRKAVRFDTALNLDVDGLDALTRNISATGVFFETDGKLPLGSLLNLSVQFTQGGRQHWLACEGKVVRTAQAGGQSAVAARLLTPFFSPVEERLTAEPAKR